MSSYYSLNTTDHLLPDGVADVLFINAQKQESLRDALLFILTAHGYQLVSPPLIEYTETLLYSADEELKRQTFKLIDQMTGRLMGLRADITPQIARIDAQHGRGVSRYCYVGQVVKTLPTGLFGLRTPMQLGAEIFGVDNVAAEMALMDLLVALFDEIGMPRNSIHIDVGQVAIFERLCAIHATGAEQVGQLMNAYAKKNLPLLNELSDTLVGGMDFLTLAMHTLDSNKPPSADHLLCKLSTIAQADTIITSACADIATLVRHIQALGMSVSIDVAELSGYHYHTGLVFNGYLNHPDTAQTQALVRGGRYLANNARQASGFSMDINRLLDFVQLQADTMIWVDYADIQTASKAQLDDLATQIKTLQDEGCVVIKPLSADDKPTQLDGVLHLDKGVWMVKLVDE